MKKALFNIGGVNIELEVARTSAEHARGLMNRPVLGLHEGMVFDYGMMVTNGFWMKDTLVALDVAFIGEDEKIFAVAGLKPLDETVIKAPAAYRWAVEMSHGWFDCNMKTVRCELARPLSELD